MPVVKAAGGVEDVHGFQDADKLRRQGTVRMGESRIVGNRAGEGSSDGGSDAFGLTFVLGTEALVFYQRCPVCGMERDDSWGIDVVIMI